MAGKYLKKKDNLWVLFSGKEYCTSSTSEVQGKLGGIVFTSLPKAGQSLRKDEPLTGVEAEKAVNEFASLLTGIVSPVNGKVGEDINTLSNSGEMSAWALSSKDVDPKESSELQNQKITRRKLTLVLPVVIIISNPTRNERALKRRVHITDAWREPHLLKMGNENEMEDGLRAE